MVDVHQTITMTMRDVNAKIKNEKSRIPRKRNRWNSDMQNERQNDSIEDPLTHYNAILPQLLAIARRISKIPASNNTSE